MKVIKANSPLVSVWNQETYQRLQAILGLNFRCQILLAVCDDLHLRDHLVQLLPLDLPEQQIITLNLNTKHPVPLDEIIQWFKENHPGKMPTFQIVGVELLTRESPAIQNFFLRHLQTLESRLFKLNYNLLIWVQEPWFHTLEKSASKFWKLQTGLFQFDSDPTPVNNYHQLTENITTNITTNQHTEQGNTYLQLANYYRDRITQGENTVENLMLAIQAYQQAILLLQFSATSLAEIFNDVGNLYLMLGKNAHYEDQKIYSLEQAICYYHQGLTKVSPHNGAQIYAMIQNNLGSVYTDLARYRDTMFNLKLAIQAYHECLHYRNYDILKYATTQNNLGTVYWQLSQYESTVIHLKSAISAYQRSINNDILDIAPLQWAMMQNNLGTVYWNLAQHEKPDIYLYLAIDAYQKSLKYRTPELNPSGYSATQNNLATAYLQLANMSDYDFDKQFSYLQLCVISYEIAINHYHILNQQNIQVSFDLFTTYNNLGLAQFDLGSNQFNLSKDKRSEYLQSALKNHLEAVNLSPKNSERYSLSLNYLLKTIRGFYRHFGTEGQKIAFAIIPVDLLSILMQKIN